MYIPVLLCGFLCGWKYGLGVGFILPLLRSVTLGMPPLFPVAAAMAVEMAIYGGVAGIAYQRAPRKGIADIYRALLLAMILGRIGWGIAELVLLTSQGDAFTWQLFFAGAFFNAIPGIVVQLLLISAIMAAIERSGYAKEAYGTKENKKQYGFRQLNRASIAAAKRLCICPERHLIRA